MKNLEKTIDRLIKIAPFLGDTLTLLREKVKKYPSRNITYWKKLSKILNDVPRDHPTWKKIKGIVTPVKKIKKKRYTFRTLHPDEKTIGSIPGNIADKIKHYDLATIALGKKKFEAMETDDVEELEKIYKKEALSDIKLKKIWVELKDYFRIWKHSERAMLNIRNKNGLLVLTFNTLPMMNPGFRMRMGNPGMGNPGMGNPGMGNPGMGLNVDKDTFKRFMDILGLNSQDFPDSLDSPDSPDSPAPDNTQ